MPAACGRGTAKRSLQPRLAARLGAARLALRPLRHVSPTAFSGPRRPQPREPGARLPQGISFLPAAFRSFCRLAGRLQRRPSVPRLFPDTYRRYLFFPNLRLSRQAPPARLGRLAPFSSFPAAFPRIFIRSFLNPRAFSRPRLPSLRQGAFPLVLPQARPLLPAGLDAQARRRESRLPPPPHLRANAAKMTL